MLSPRSAYVTLLKSKKDSSRDKLRNIYMHITPKNKTKTKTLNQSKSPQKYLLSRVDSLTSRKSEIRIQTTTRQSINRSGIKSARQLSRDVINKDARDKSKVQMKSKSKYEEESKKFMKGENCRIVVKENGGQSQYFHQVQDISSIRNFLRQNCPNHKGFTTLPRQLSLEFFLTQNNINGQFLNGQTLYLKPEMSTKYTKNQENVRVTLKDFQIIKPLGSGGFSTVFLCKSKIDHCFYALKLIQKEMVVKNKKKGIVMNERNIMTKAQHPFVVDLKYAFESQKYIAFVLEYCTGGQLFGLIKKYGRLSQDVARFYIIEILLGLSYLHSQKVVYRDIKPQNILIGIDGHVKIADLGLAKPDMETGKLAHSFCGSPEYMAPEMIMQAGHTYPVDFYCVGALLYQLLTGLPPFYSQDPNQIYEAVLNEQLTFPSDVDMSPECKSLLKALLNKDPAQRLGSLYGSKQILIHPWFGKRNFKDYSQKNVSPPVTFTSLEKINLDEIDEKHQQTLDKTLKNQKLQGNNWKEIMKNFYYDSKIKEQPKDSPPSSAFKQKNRSNSKQKSKTMRLTSPKSFGRQNAQNANVSRKMTKRSTNNMTIQNSLKYFFKK